VVNSFRHPISDIPPACLSAPVFYALGMKPFCWLLLISLGVISSGWAKKPNNDKKQEAVPPPKKEESWLEVRVFTPQERQVIEKYVVTEQTKDPKKAKKLPPGLAKKVAQGKSLPPGWQKKLNRGEVISREVYHECAPLPPTLLSKLPPPPSGTVLVTVDGKILRLAEASLTILDVFDLSSFEP
jgi:hypothetical protein